MLCTREGVRDEREREMKGGEGVRDTGEGVRDKGEGVRDEEEGLREKAEGEGLREER